MKYGVLSENDSINTVIYECFKYIPEASIKVFAKIFGNTCKDRDSPLHTFRELIVETSEKDRFLGGLVN